LAVQLRAGVSTVSCLTALPWLTLQDQAGINTESLNAAEPPWTFIDLAGLMALTKEAGLPLWAVGIFIDLAITIIIDSVTDVSSKGTTETTGVTNLLIDMTIAVIIQTIAALLYRLLPCTTVKPPIKADLNPLGADPREPSGAGLIEPLDLLIYCSITVIIETITDLSLRFSSGQTV